MSAYGSAASDIRIDHDCEHCKARHSYLPPFAVLVTTVYEFQCFNCRRTTKVDKTKVLDAIRRRDNSRLVDKYNLKKPKPPAKTRPFGVIK